MTVVAAVGSEDGSEPVLKEAIKLATASDEELHVVHVRDYSDLKQGAESDADIDKRSVQQQIEDDASRLASPFTDEFTPVGLIGKPASKVVSYAEPVDATHLVIGGKKQSPVGKAMFGDTSQRILLNATCPVITTLRRISSQTENCLKRFQRLHKSISERRGGHREESFTVSNVQLDNARTDDADTDPPSLIGQLIEKIATTTSITWEQQHD